MKKMIVLSIVLAASVQALAATAYFTGNQRHVTSVTGILLLQCEYAYGDTKFWVTTKATMCPVSVEIE